MQLAEERIERDQNGHIREHLRRQNDKQQGTCSPEMEAREHIARRNCCEQRQEHRADANNQAVLEVRHEALLVGGQDLVTIERWMVWPPGRRVLESLQLRLYRSLNPPERRGERLGEQ